MELRCILESQYQFYDEVTFIRTMGSENLTISSIPSSILETSF